MSAVEEHEEAHRLARTRSEIDNCLDLVRTRRVLAETQRRLVIASRPNCAEVALIMCLVVLSYLLGLLGAAP
jgi:hypothetical protein